MSFFIILKNMANLGAAVLQASYKAQRCAAAKTAHASRRGWFRILDDKTLEGFATSSPTGTTRTQMTSPPPPAATTPATTTLFALPGPLTSLSAVVAAPAPAPAPATATAAAGEVEGATRSKSPSLVLTIAASTSATATAWCVTLPDLRPTHAFNTPNDDEDELTKNGGTGPSALALALSPTGQARLFSIVHLVADDEERVRIIDVPVPLQRSHPPLELLDSTSTLTSPPAISLSFDGLAAAVAATTTTTTTTHNGPPAIRVWRVDQGDFVAELRPPPTQETHVVTAMSINGAVVAAVLDNGSAFVWWSLNEAPTQLFLPKTVHTSTTSSAAAAAASRPLPCLPTLRLWLRAHTTTAFALAPRINQRACWLDTKALWVTSPCLPTRK